MCLSLDIWFLSFFILYLFFLKLRAYSLQFFSARKFFLRFFEKFSAEFNIQTPSENLHLLLSLWFVYRKGKKPSHNLDYFQYNLDEELHTLRKVLNNSTYKHEGYRKFTVTDNKKREISVASVRDRVVHRLLYDYLVGILDQNGMMTSLMH